MIDSRMFLIAAFGLVGLTGQSTAHAQDPDSPRYKGVITLSDFLTSTGDEALQEFAATRVSPSLRDAVGQDRIRGSLAQLRSEFAGAKLSGAGPEGPLAANVRFSNHESISFELEPDPPHRFLRIGSLGKSTTKNVGPTSFEQLDEQLTAEAAAETFSGVVLVARGAEPVFHQAYGYANRAAGKPNRTDTKFNIGSINKIFTMVAVYQLIDAGKLAADDTIGKFLPGFPAEVADRVTIQHLLKHRSGWGAYWENPTFLARRNELRSLDDYMAFIKDIPLDFEPGSRMQYSNTGYEVLGAIVEKVSRQSYYDYVRDHIYTPAGMVDTDAYDRESDTPNMAVGYTGGGYARDNASMLAVKGTAAGGGFSTTTDLLRFAMALDAGKLLPGQHARHLRGGAFAGGGPGVSAVTNMSVAGDYKVIVLSNFDMPAATNLSGKINAMLRENYATVHEVSSGAAPGMRGGSTSASSGIRYRIGVGFAPHDDGLGVHFLEPDGPGEKGGLQPDDVILAINGTPIADDPVGHLDAALTTPDPMELKIRRAGRPTSVTLRPEPIGGKRTKATTSGGPTDSQAE